MIQVNFTLFIQIINFLVLLFILNAILYKPLMAKMREREAMIRSDQEKAAELEQQVQDQENQHQAELAKARQTAAQEKNALMAQAKAQESEVLDKARLEANRIVDEMKALIHQQAGAAREALTVEMTPLAHSISEKIMGRSI